MSEFLAGVVERELAKRWPRLYKMAEAKVKAKSKARKRGRSSGSSLRLK